jgi:hypothetical protein
MEFVARVHRHHGRPPGYRYAVAVVDGNRLCGVGMAGRPVNRVLADGHTIEVTRVATDGTPNAASMLYGACWRAARALGYTRGTTYTQDGETGASLRAAGWVLVAELPARAGWGNRPADHAEYASVSRYRWEIRTPTYAEGLALASAATEDGPQQPSLDLEAVA